MTPGQGSGRRAAPSPNQNTTPPISATSRNGASAGLASTAAPNTAPTTRSHAGSRPARHEAAMPAIAHTATRSGAASASRIAVGVAGDRVNMP